MLLHCFIESCRVRRKQIQAAGGQAASTKVWILGRRTEYQEGLVLNTLYLMLRLPSTFGLKMGSWSFVDFKHHKPETSPNGDSHQLLKMAAWLGKLKYISVLLPELESREITRGKAGKAPEASESY